MFGFFKQTNEEAQVIPEKKERKRSFKDVQAAIKRMTIDKIMNNTFKRSASDDLAVGYTMDDNSLGIKAAMSYSGGNIPEGQLSWYSSQGFIGFQSCAIIAQNWLVMKACTMPARDAIRKGYKVTLNDGTSISPENADKIRDLNKKYKLDRNLVEFVKMGNIFGIRICMFIVESNDPEYYEKPFNIDGVSKGSYKGISQIDPYWCAPELDMESATDPTSQHFYEPTFWLIGSQRIHRSHLVIFKGDEVPDILKPTYLYAGISLTQKIYERVYAAERTSNEAPQLVMTKRTKVYKADLEEMAANPDVLYSTITAAAELADNYGVRVIGLDEDVQQLDTALGDLDTVIMTQYQLVSAVSEVPATKLLGTSPKGFGASGEYEEASYREKLETIQQNDFLPLMERHLMIMAKSDFDEDDINFTIVFEPLDSLTEIEQAAINYQNSQTATNYANIGAIDGEDVRKKITSDPKSGYILEDHTDETNEE